MRMGKWAVGLALIGLSLLFGHQRFALSAAAGDNPHDIGGQQPAEYCDACHVDKPGVYTLPSSLAVIPAWQNFQPGMDGTAMCVVCHDRSAASHEVGGDKIDFAVPADLPLAADNTLTCMTCHYMHGSLSSDRPWASVSFMDKLTGHERLRKSYLLRRNNSGGELCLVCHNPGQQ